MFPELKPLFQDAFDEAKEGSVYCIEKTRDDSVNLRTHMIRIIRRAGLEPWPKLFQNLRSTRETELFKMTGGNVKAVCRWIGNTPEVAMKHYAQVTEADMNEAAKMSLMEGAEQRVQNTVHPTTKSRCRPVQGKKMGIDITPYDYRNLPSHAGVCNDLQKNKICPGLESNQHEV